jgi:hypothetical protein
MKLRVALLALSLFLLGTGSAQAAPSITFRDILRELASIPIPPEWAGVWTGQDTSYNCSPMTFRSANTETDTLCAGANVGTPGPGLPFAIDCTGTSDATTVHYHCTGSGQIIPGCTASIDVVTDVTRSGDTFYAVTTAQETYTGAGCLGIPNQCTISHTHGTRIAPPPATCATPALPATWGNVKAHYR